MNDYKENYFHSGNIKLSWTEWGSGNSDVIVLLHGPTDCASSWGIAAEYLSGQYRVIALTNAINRETNNPKTINFSRSCPKALINSS